MPSVEIPYASSLPKLRALLEASRDGRSLAAVGAALRLSDRHVDYYAGAAQRFGLASREGAALKLTALGRELLGTEQGSGPEAAVYRRAHEGCSGVKTLAPDLFAARGPSKAELVQRFVGDGGMKKTTADQRARALLSARKYVLGHERQITLAELAGPAVEYKGNAVLTILRISSFKAFGAGEAKGATGAIEMAPLTVFAGPNGAGKSTILQALYLLGALVRGTIREALEPLGWDYSDLPHLRAHRQTVTIEVDVTFGPTRLRWSLTLGARKHPGIEEERVSIVGPGTETEIVLLQRKGRNVTVRNERSGADEAQPPLTLAQSWLSTRDPKADARKYPSLLRLKNWAEGIHAFWSLDPSVLRATSRGATSIVGPHGGDLASVLFRLRKRDPARFRALVKRVAAHYPKLVDIEPKSSAYGWKFLEITERWNGEKAKFNQKQVSDGLLRLIAIASIRDWETRPSLILLDEIENGLHPRLLASVTRVLNEDLRDVAQVVATSHSPITLNYVPAEGVRLVTRGHGGSVRVTPITATNGYARLREHFEPGELWYNVGEERLLTVPERRK